MSETINEKSKFLNVLKYFVVFATGILVGYLITSCFIKSPKALITFDKEYIKGFSGNNLESNSPGVNIDIADLKATINSSNTQGVVVSEVNCVSENPVKIVIYFDENELSIYGLKPIQTEKNSSIAGGKNSIQITCTGNNKFLVLWKDKHRNDNNIDVQVFSDNIIVYSTSYIVH